MIRQLQPAAVINNRGFGDGDFGTPERDWDNSVKTSLAFPQPTEAGNSVGSESWATGQMKTISPANI
jgi:alpha-L-fucosidase